MISYWEIRELIKKTPNDSVLGTHIRNLYHKEKDKIYLRIKKINEILKLIEELGV